MSQNKAHRSRRAAAIALAVVGAAGLSMAAAAQLNLNYSGSFQAGAATITADCQTDKINVGFHAPTFAATQTPPWTVASVDFSNIAAACSGKTYEVAYKAGGDWVQIGSSDNGTGTVSGTTLTVTIPSAVNVQNITQVALTIHS